MAKRAINIIIYIIYRLTATVCDQLMEMFIYLVFFSNSIRVLYYYYFKYDQLIIIVPALQII